MILTPLQYKGILNGQQVSHGEKKAKMGRRGARIPRVFMEKITLP
jgi:hypothetical protein